MTNPDASQALPTLDVPASGGRAHVIFDDGTRDIDAAIAQLAAEGGMGPSDEVMILCWLGEGELPADMAQAQVTGPASGDNNAGGDRGES